MRDPPKRISKKYHPALQYHNRSIRSLDTANGTLHIYSSFFLPPQPGYYKENSPRTPRVKQKCIQIVKVYQIIWVYNAQRIWTELINEKGWTTNQPTEKKHMVTLSSFRSKLIFTASCTTKKTSQQHICIHGPIEVTHQPWNRMK